MTGHCSTNVMLAYITLIVAGSRSSIVPMGNEISIVVTLYNH